MKTEVLLKKKLKEVYMVDPTELGSPFLTKFYRFGAVYFKNKPFLIILPVSLLIGVALYLIFGPLVVKLVSLLQYGF